MTVLEDLLFPPTRLSPKRLARAVAGRTVLITGASFGIGEATALLLARAGAQVVLVARTAEKLRAVAAQIEAAGGRAIILPADLTRDRDIDALLAALPPLDILVSNAGKSIRRSLWASLDRPQDVARTIALNHVAPTRLVLGLATTLRARGGQVVNVSAANVLLAPAPGWAAYQASKAALDQWLRATRPELVAMGVAVSTIYLPLVRTRMIAPTAAYHRAPAMSPEHAARLVARAIVTRQRAWKPWWVGAGELASLLLRPVWERGAVAWVRRHG